MSGVGGNSNPPGNGNPSADVPYYDSNNLAQVNFNPTTAILIIVLIGGCLVAAFIATVVRRCVRSDNPAASSTAQSSNVSSKPRGLHKEVVDALPLIYCKDLDEKDDRECPVCLTEFEPEDNLRLLPACKHIFHQECIDAWFDSHSTCPLCRASLLDHAGVKERLNGEQVALGEPVETITEVSEHGDSDTDSQRVSNVSPLEDQSANAVPMPGALTSREDERNSARGTLSRNSLSFKRAARGIEAYEKGAALPVNPSSKNASFRKPPVAPPTNPGIRRSSSMGTDLIALRNLLTGGDSTRETSASYRLNASRSAVPKSDAPSGSWFRRARSMNLGVGESTLLGGLTRERSEEQWVTIDLETGKTAAAGPSSSKGESFKAPIASTAAPERAWSDRYSLASIRGALSRTTSDVSSRIPHLPV